MNIIISNFVNFTLKINYKCLYIYLRIVKEINEEFMPLNRNSDLFRQNM